MSVSNLQIPTYVQQTNEENYNEELNQTLQYLIGVDGWKTPQITAANLAIISADPLTPNGTLWFVTDAVPPGPVMLVSGTVVRLATAPYP